MGISFFSPWPMCDYWEGCNFREATMTKFEAITATLTLLLVILGIITVVLMAFQAGAMR